MPSVTELYGRHPGADIFVVGTGASLRVFPVDFLAGRVSIGLNLAWQVAPVRYGLTTRPELNVPEFLGAEPRPGLSWITKRDKLRGDEQRAHGDERFFYFSSRGKAHRPAPGEPNETGRMLEWVRRPTGDKLYLWTSVSQTALNLAANMGAANVILVGCDNCALLGNHHAHGQHTMWKGEDPDVRYRQYYDGLCEVRAVLRERGVRVLSLDPFLSLDRPQLDFTRLCAELGRPRYVENRDISAELEEVASVRELLRHYRRRSAQAGRVLLRAVRRRWNDSG